MLNWHEYKAFPIISHDYDLCHIYLYLLEKTFPVAVSFLNLISIRPNLESGFGMSKVNSKSVLVYELIGMMFIILLGSALHFTFEIFGKSPLVGVFSAVNECVWEHLKLAFWPALLYMLVEYAPLKKSANNFLFAKTAGACLMIVLIPIVFYSYTAVAGESIFIIDISTFVVAVVIGQLLSFKLLSYKKLSENYSRLSIILLVLLALAFALFTFYPPQLPIFRDPITGKYGIAG